MTREVALPSVMAEEIVVELKSRLTAISDQQHRRGTDSNPRIPFPETLGAILDVAFFATCAREEGEFLEFTLAYHPSGSDQSQLMVLDRPVECSVGAIKKLAKALRPHSSALAVREIAGHRGAAEVWALPASAMDLPILGQAHPVNVLVHCPSPGVLFVELYGETIAIHQHGFNSVLHRANPASDNLFERVEAIVDDGRSARKLQDVVLHMWGHRHGGLLFVVDTEADADDLTFRYRLTPASSVLTNAQPTVLRAETPHATVAALSDQRTILADAAYRAVAARAGRLTAVDGALVVAREMAVLGFGAMVTTTEVDFGSVRATTIDPSVGITGEKTLDEILGRRGARHRAAAAFIATRKSIALAFVSSQDGDLSVFIRDPLITVVSPFLTPLFSPT